MANLWAKFARLLPDEPTIIGTITAHNVDGTSTVATLAGGTMRVRGQSVVVGNKAFIRHGEITGEAPDLPAYEVTV